MTEPIDRPDTAATGEPPPKRRGGGPRTPEGKERSKRNALKHGLRAKLLLPDELALRLERRTEEVHLEYNPRTPHQETLLADVARCLVLIERCAELAVADRGRVAARADDAWDDDRRLEVEQLGAKLALNPGPVAEALSQTRHGADWLIRHWHGLAVAARVAGRWDDAQRQLAFDLLGTPAALRPTSDELPAADAPGEELAAFAEAWVEGLRKARAVGHVARAGAGPGRVAVAVEADESAGAEGDGEAATARRQALRPLSLEGEGSPRSHGGHGEEKRRREKILIFTI